MTETTPLPRSKWGNEMARTTTVADLLARPEGLTVADAAKDLGLTAKQVRNQIDQIRKKSGYAAVTALGNGRFVLAAETASSDCLRLAGKEFRSRLIVGTGKYRDFEETRKAIEMSGAEIVTVAVRRVNIIDRDQENLLDYLDPKKFTILPNTAGCYTPEEAVRTCRLAREAGVGSMVKLEVIGDDKTLFPDTPGTLEAARVLVADGFTVLPYISDDVVTAKKLEDMGCAAVMPLAAPIGSGLGIRNPYNIRIIQESVSIPVIVDAGVGTASDAAIVMEMGCDGVLMNTAIAGAKDPILMADAMKQAVEAGRKAFLAGRIPRKLYATASSPIEGLLH